jgi:hypothetical protein
VISEVALSIGTVAARPPDKAAAHTLKLVGNNNQVSQLRSFECDVMQPRWALDDRYRVMIQIAGTQKDKSLII